MKETQKKQLKATMEKKQAELIKLIADLKESTKPMGLDNSIGRVSRMDYINNKSVSEASLRKAEDDLVSLERWLSLYDTEKFGKCSRCGNEINLNRLLLLPTSTRCVNCSGR